MADQLVIDNGNIITINDPNNVNVWHSGEGADRVNQINGAPPYEDMFIFAELTAVSKARTILVSGGDGTKYHVDDNGMNDTLRVNFMGNDQNLESDDRTNPNYLNFTTNYYDGSTGNNINYESFGMSSINVIINSSFIPQVNIQFIDVRGLSFFNENNAPYRILFDFPPPIFQLTIKGYYGKTLSYRLHLVKYTSEFKSENGNFVIDAQFVAMTYAPLTDVLFRYVINFPLINQATRTGDPSTSIRPVNTNDLIIKLKNLYSAVSDLLKTDKDAIEYDENISKLDANTEILGLVQNFSNELTDKNGRPFLLQRNTVSGYDLKPNDNYEGLDITTFTDYNVLIKKQSTDGIPTQMDEKLIIAYIVTPNDDGKNEDTLIAITETYLGALEAYKTFLLNKAVKLGDTGDYSDNLIYNPNTFRNNYNAADQKIYENVKTKYAFIDITEFYLILYKNRQDIQDKLTELTELLNITINNMVLQNLGMTPTIYNVFKVILDDVDTFFNIIRSTSRDAEERHHVVYKNLIVDSAQYADIKISDSNSTNQIYAFPLVINQKPVCGGFTEERVAPLDLSNSLPEQFPELILVDDFINTFFTQKHGEFLANLKAEQDEAGAHIWIPISPIDSVLASTQIQSPYIGIDATDGGSVFQPINDKGDARLNQVLSIVLKRFYILTQSIIPNSFYSTQEQPREAYIELYSVSEANNLAISITETKYGDNIQAIAQSWARDPNWMTQNQTEFYTYLENNLNEEFYDFSEADKPFFPMSGNDPDRGINAYVDKNNADYVGLEISDKVINLRKAGNVGDSPIDTFQDGLRKNVWQRVIEGGSLPEAFFSFTTENVLYLKDIKTKNKKDGTKEVEGEHIDGVQTDTRFLAARYTIDTGVGTNAIRLYNSSEVNNKNVAIDSLLDEGNSGFGGLGGYAVQNAHKLNAFEDVVKTWATELSENDAYISASTIYSISKLASLVYLSNFGWTQGVFNGFPQNLNALIFDNPSVIDSPKFLPQYLGALIDAAPDRGNWIDDIKDYFTGDTDGGQYLKSSGLYVFADYHDVHTLLSEKDKDVLWNYFKRFYDNEFNNISEQMQLLFVDVQDAIVDVPDRDRARRIAKEKEYQRLLSDEYFPTTVGKFLERTSIINYNQNTFNTWTGDEIGYQSLKSLNETQGNKNINDSYFKNFFSSLQKAIIKKKNAEEKEKAANSKLKGDEDILTQTYYSFKNINDKWLSSPVRPNPQGYPFNEPGKNLIDSFAFVDRAMNPVGDTIINPEILIDLFDDHTVSVFGVLSQLLSTNGFEFFPLQNFMTHDSDSWIDSFKIDVSTKARHTPAFVCMYIGGTSSYPTGIRNGFVDDGIIDITTTNAMDFNTKDDCEGNPEADNQMAENTDFKDNYKSVRAFRVKFGEQNQSMFKDIKIESKEYPETNESIQILSRISGDNKLQAPIPKGQNLYNLYENRAYKASVSGLGNAMIQPTQYFQLDNIPMFNGAYLILNVEHNIVPNKMTTKFAGTKILQFPIPRVLDSATLFGFGGGASHRTRISSMSAAGVATGLQAYNMSQDRLKQLDSVYGVDVSYAQKGMDWSKLPKNDTKVDFALIKLSQGESQGDYQSNFNDSQVEHHVAGAQENGLKFTYYHFAGPYIGSDVVGNATTQAQFFVDSIPNKNLPRPDFPLILDFENKDTEVNPRKWSVNKNNNDLWINTFVDVVKDADYDVILYINDNMLKYYTNGDFGDLPLWYANPIKSKTESSEYESSTPTAPKPWKDWSIWQFSWEGKVSGWRGIVDINAMRKSFFNKYPKVT